MTPTNSKLRDFLFVAFGTFFFLVSSIFFYNQTKKLLDSCPVLRHERPNDLYTVYAEQNEKYFDFLLPLDTTIDWDEYRDIAMGSTKKLLNGRFHISLNEKYCLAERTAYLTLLHEECHIIAWDEHERGFVHGFVWQGCMLNAERRGANREILIDNYEGK